MHDNPIPLISSMHVYRTMGYWRCDYILCTFLFSVVDMTSRYFSHSFSSMVKLLITRFQCQQCFGCLFCHIRTAGRCSLL